MLLGCFLSEGSTFAQHSGYGIDIHQVKPAGKARFEAEVRPALRAAGFNCSSGGNGKYRVDWRPDKVAHIRQISLVE